MKYLIPFFIICLLHQLKINAQHMDMQWHVLHERGLDGSKTVGNNAIDPDPFQNRPSIWDNPLEGDFSINGIYPPGVLLDPRADDDLFVMYNDGEYFNTRYSPTNWNYTPYIDETLSMSFASPDNRQISYLNFTNKYDIDDLPEKVIVRHGVTGTLNGLGVSNFVDDLGSMYPVNNEGERLFEIENNYIQSNHGVVPHKDVTLIIYSDNLSGEYKLYYNKVIHDTDLHNSNWSAALVNDDIFEPSHVFENNRFIIPSIAHSMPANGEFSFEISTQSAPKHLFINLRATAELEKYLPTDHDSFHVIYELRDNGGQLVARHVDPNRPTNDPNEVVLEDVCLDCRTAYYQGQFYNETPKPAKGLAFEFTFPPEIDGSTYKMIDLRVNKNRVTGHTAIVMNNRLIVELPDQLAIRSIRDTNNMQLSLVEFAVCVNFDSSSTKTQMRNQSLLVLDALTYFHKGQRGLEKDYILHAKDATQFFGEPDQLTRKVNEHCDLCKAICQKSDVVKPDECKWYNCFAYWLIDFRWLYGVFGLGIIASLFYYLGQKDKQRIQ